ncbi:MAG: sigma-70 family RNA polymerase sigma factor [Deltaproteobacteria bacterium]|nr:sigma-70 family RNA polymerase sigma factor [Deltaproteobacteria bacterium]
MVRRRLATPLSPAEFEALVRAEQGWLVRYLTYLLHDRSDAEEVAQRVFVRAYQRSHQYQGGNLRAWLRKIATHLAYNFSRDRGTRRRYEDQAVPAERLTHPSPEGALLEREAIAVTLGALPYPYREVLLMRYLEELDLPEMAGLLGIGESGVKMRLLRAREAFQAVYGSRG